jgi:diguanylate cyclase (GGDEF)-like protein
MPFRLSASAPLVSNTPAWHRRAALAQVVMTAIAFLAALTSGDDVARAGAFASGWIAASTIVWITLRHRAGVRTLLVWPLLVFAALVVASVVVPHGASLILSFIVVGFMFAGLTQRPGSSLPLLPAAMLAQWLVIDLPAPQAAIRTSIAACVWVAVAELPAWLNSSLRAARQELARQASTDPLTGMANRRAWEPVLSRLLEEARGSGRPLTVLILDLDHFKAFNDSRGHLAGDELLRAFAQRILAVAPPPAIAARWGGEEFVVAIPGVTHTEAVAVAERIRGIVPEEQSCSIGLAASEAADTDLTLLGRADAALYRAKEQGRDRVEAA